MLLIYESCVVYVILAMLSDCTSSLYGFSIDMFYWPCPCISYITACVLRVVILSQRSATGAFTLSYYILDSVHHVEILIALLARIFLLCGGPDAQGTFHYMRSKLVTKLNYSGTSFNRRVSTQMGRSKPQMLV